MNISLPCGCLCPYIVVVSVHVCVSDTSGIRVHESWLLVLWEKRWLRAKCASFLEQAAGRQLAATVKVTAPNRLCDLDGHQDGGQPALSEKVSRLSLKS